MRKGVESLSPVDSNKRTLNFVNMAMLNCFYYIYQAFLRVTLVIETLLSARTDTIYYHIYTVIYSSRDYFVEIRE
jgi:hypothetical protein